MTKQTKDIPSKYLITEEDLQSTIDALDKIEIFKPSIFVDNTNRIKETIKQARALMKDLNESLSKCKGDEKLTNRAEDLKAKVQATIDEAKKIKKESRLEEQTFRTYVEQKMDASDGLNKYKMPNSIDYDDEEINEMFNEKRPKMLFKQGLKGEKNAETGRELTEEEMEHIMKYTYSQVVPIMIEVMGTEIGKLFQTKMKGYRDRLDSFISKIPSLKKGKTYPND